MRLALNIRSLSGLENGCVATLGNFDGVHLGHRAVIDRLVDAGRNLALPVCIILFEPQPREYFDPVHAPPRLMQISEKLTCLSELPIDQVLLLRFNPTLAAWPAEMFVEKLLVEALKVQFFVIGDDFRFGYQRCGDFALLCDMGKKFGFQVVDTPSVELDNERVSSTLVRETLLCGNLEQARRYLGRPYSISGRIIHGDERGRTLGFPTANILIRRRNSPVQGVFAVIVRGLGITAFPGVANIGVRPTITGKQNVLLETHLFDFSGDLYGHRVEVAFHHKLRDEQRFDSLLELRNQIQHDVIAAKTFFAAY